MPLSRRWTSERFWKKSHRGVFYDVNDPVQVERFEIMKGVQENVVGLVPDLVSQSYMEPIVMMDTNVGAYSTGAGTYTALTKTLVITTNTGFVSTDKGKMVTFREGNDIYTAFIRTVSTANTIIIRGDKLPAADIAVVDWLMMAPSTPDSGGTIELTAIEFMRVGTQVKVRVTSDVTTFVRFLPEEEFQVWDPTDDQHSIVWTLIGDTIYIKKGTLLGDFGTITVWVPRVPIGPTTNAAYMDLPDGPMIEIAAIACEKELRKRKGLPVEDRSKELQDNFRLLFRQFDAQAKLETIDEKVKALA